MRHDLEIVKELMKNERLVYWKLVSGFAMLLRARLARKTRAALPAGNELNVCSRKTVYHIYFRFSAVDVARVFLCMFFVPQELDCHFSC